MLKYRLKFGKKDVLTNIYNFESTVKNLTYSFFGNNLSK